MLQSFQECGASAWLTLLLALLATAFGLVGLAAASSSPRLARSASMIALVAVVLVAASGFFGMLLGRSATDRAVANVVSAEREVIRAEGYREAEQCTRVAGVADALPTVLALLALVVATRRARATS